jgi:hypothetical protein
MLPFGALLALFIGTELVLFFIFCVVLIKLPMEKLARLCYALFGFKPVWSDTDQTISINICGDRYELSTKLSTRIPLAVTFSMCFLVIAVVFADGCVFSGRYLLPSQPCLDQFPHCYLLDSGFSLYPVTGQLVCQPNELVISSNMSAARALCFGFLLPSQSTVDILNQMGVCSGIFSIVKVLYPFVYRFGRRHMGAICLICLSCGIFVTEILLVIMQYSLSVVTFVLLSSTAFLLDTVIYIHWRRRKTRKPHLPQFTMDSNKF